MSDRDFRLTPEHLLLLSKLYIEADDEYGMPVVNGKRPLGNSDIVNDVCMILGFQPIETSRGEEVYTAEHGKSAARILSELTTAMQILLSGQSAVGLYRNTAGSYGRAYWELTEAAVSSPAVTTTTEAK